MGRSALNVTNMRRSDDGRRPTVPRPLNHGSSPRARHPGKAVLVVDDDEHIRRLICDALRRDGEFHPVEAADSATARALAAEHPDALMLLDITLPDHNGLDLLRELRRHSDRPVIILTGRGSETDRVLGLELGADDYVVKPCFPREVLARIRTVLRRTQVASRPSAPMRFGRLEIDAERRVALVDGAPIDLTAREFDLLLHLANRPGRVFTRSDLLRDVWSSEPGWQSEATVTEHVYRLRTKLGIERGTPGWVQTVRGVGYRLET